MRRRRFLGALGGAAVGLGWSPRLLGRVAGGEGAVALTNWTWVHGGRERTEAEWRARFTRVREAGIHGVLVGGGNVDHVGRAARASDLKYQRWVWTLNRNGDRWAKETHPEWFTVNRNGESSLEKPPYVGYYKWVCPTRAPVREYLNDLVGRIAGDPLVHGVHLDYIRHPDVILPVGLWSRYDLVQDREYAEFDYCYCDVCRETFARQSGTDPLDLPDPPADAAWRRFRWDSITRLVRELTATVHAAGKQISAAVFPTPAMSRLMVHQSWDEWPLDAHFPMLYHDFYQEEVDWIGDATREGVGALPYTAALYSGLYLPHLSPDDLGRAVRVARDAGASGVALFEMDRLTDDHLAALQRALPL